MQKLTAEKCRDRIARLKECEKLPWGLSIDGIYQLQALEIALPILEQQERGEGEWIEWGGGDRPLGYHAGVTVRYRDGEELDIFAGHQVWSHSGDEDDIIAYRIIPDQPTNQNGEQ